MVRRWPAAVGIEAGADKADGPLLLRPSLDVAGKSRFVFPAAHPCGREQAKDPFLPVEAVVTTGLGLLKEAMHLVGWEGREERVSVLRTVIEEEGFPEIDKNVAFFCMALDEGTQHLGVA